MNKIFYFVLIFVFFASAISCSKNGKDAVTTATVTGTSTTTGEAKPAEVTVTPTETEFVEKPLDPKDIVPPMQAIKDLDKRIEGYHLGQALTPEQLEANRKLKQDIIRGTFDIRELCHLSLGKHWDTLKTEQQKHFVDLMTKLLETRAIFSREQLHGADKLYNIQYKKETFDDAEKTKATVITKMIISREKIDFDITYKMLLTPYGWKIFDVIVDESSLMMNYKSQFDRIIVKSGFDELINLMNTKLKSIEAGK